MSDKRSPLFLARDSYRQRRLADAARVLPILGGVLMMLPLLWPREGADAQSMSGAIIYVFGCWVLLVIASFILSRWLDGSVTQSGDDDPTRSG